MSTSNFLRVGLTGVIGSGKSLTISFFEKYNWKTFSCDAAVHELLSKDILVKERLVGLFGDGLLDSQNHIIRSRLAGIIFADPRRREQVEGIFHPLVREKWQNAISQDPLNQWVVEVPLLFEKNLEKFFDLSVCVGCRPEVQMDRLLQRGWSLQEIKSRLDSQLPLQAKISRANTVFWNDGAHKWLEAQVRHWIQHVAPNTFSIHSSSLSK